MNKLYLIVPIVLTLAFSAIYTSHSKQAAAKAEIARVAYEQAEADALARKQEAERQAREDADRRTTERLAEERKKEEEKRVRWEAAGREIAADTASYEAQATKSAGEVKALEGKLAELRIQKEAASQAEFDHALEVERERVRKRNAELEIQRLVEIVARKGGTTLGSVGAIQ